MGGLSLCGWLAPSSSCLLFSVLTPEMVFFVEFFPACTFFFFKGGDTKLLMILCVSPGQKNMAETLQGLGFGTRARQAERDRQGRALPTPG
jgi:hypothetical protein